MRIFVDGHAVHAGPVAYRAVVNYGHFTSMQVRAGCVRGLDLHLCRLRAATRELFDADLNTAQVREYLSAATAGDADCTARVDIFSHEDDESMAVMITTEPAREPKATPATLQSVEYQRPLAHIKHTGGFAQIYYQRAAQANGFDEALLTDGQGTISETVIANIGFLDGDTVVRPNRPALHGVTWQLLDHILPQHGFRIQSREVTLRDVTDYDAAFMTNSIGITPVSRIDSQTVQECPASLLRMQEAYQHMTWDRI